MKRVRPKDVCRRIWTVVCFVAISGLLQAQPTFTKGVNLTGWFQAESAHQIQFSKFTKKDFERIKVMM